MCHGLLLSSLRRPRTILFLFDNCCCRRLKEGQVAKIVPNDCDAPPDASSRVGDLQSQGPLAFPLTPDPSPRWGEGERRKARPRVVVMLPLKGRWRLPLTPRPNGSDSLGQVYLTLPEAKIQFKAVEPRNARVDLLGPQLGRQVLEVRGQE
jgi:hypothetical protein